MIHATRKTIRKWLERLLHVHDSPQRTAAAFALGVFIGFSPLWGLHTILGIVLAFALGLNRVAVLVGVYSNLPWITAEWYVLMTAFGAWVLRTGLPPALYASLRELFTGSVFHIEFWRQLWLLLKPLLWPFAVGSTIGAAILAAMSFPIARTFVETGRRYAAEYHRHHRHREESAGADSQGTTGTDRH